MNYKTKQCTQWIFWCVKYEHQQEQFLSAVSVEQIRQKYTSVVIWMLNMKAAAESIDRIFPHVGGPYGGSFGHYKKFSSGGDEICESLPPEGIKKKKKSAALLALTLLAFLFFSQLVPDLPEGTNAVHESNGMMKEIKCKNVFWSLFFFY